MEYLPDGCAGKCFAGGGKVEQAVKLARPERPPPQARIVEGDTEYSNKHKENVFTGGGTVGAGAGWGGGDVHGVDVSSGAKDEEKGVGAVEQAEAVANGADDAVGEGLSGVEAVALQRWAVVVRRGGAGRDGLHEQKVSCGSWDWRVKG